LAVAGLGGSPLDDGARRSLAALGGAACVFSVLAVALWAQLAIGWQWSSPDTVATSAAMVVMSAGVGLVGLVVVAAMAPMLWLALRDVARGGARRELLGPLCAVLGGLAVLIFGTHHFASGWPGTRGHPWANQGLVPGGAAADAWASTLFVTTYWLHPDALMRFPATEVVWMVTSPLAITAVVVGGARIVRRLQVPAKLLRYERRLGIGAAVVMSLYLAGAALWVTEGGPGPRNLFHIGAIDVVELAAMAVMVVVVLRAADYVSRDTRHNAAA
jgi:hypothetical protein